MQVKFLPAEVEVYLTKDSLTLYEALIEVGDEVAPVAKLHGVDNWFLNQLMPRSTRSFTRMWIF